MDDKIVNESLIAGTVWFPADAGNFAYGVDSLYHFIMWGSIIVFAGILLVSVMFIWKYRKRKGYTQASGPHVTHNALLEFAWTVPPLLLTLFIFYWGFIGFLDMATPPRGAEEIHVIGKKWIWQFEYKNGSKNLTELVVPVNTPVKLLMTSEDVLHSFFVPNLRIKRDVIPNRYTTVWFNATRTGNFQLFCTEYCGDSHSNMSGTVRVVTVKEYNEWLKSAGAIDESLPPEELGQKVYTAKGCVACHSVDGAAGVGPTFKGLWGAKRSFVGGGTAVADENYIRESVLNPGGKVVSGYQSVMPSYTGLLNDREIAGVIAYLKTLK